jgi:hypothetical protein
VAPRANQNLAFKFFGPYTILQRNGPLAYKLQLPEHPAIHLVFHVSQLKSALGSQHQFVPELPPATNLLLVPLQVVKRRMIRRGGCMVAQVKVIWSRLDPSLVTWDDAAALQSTDSISSCVGLVASGV